MNDVSATILNRERPLRARVGLQARVRWVLLLGAWGLLVYPLVPILSYANNVYGFTNRISLVPLNCQSDEFYHRWNGIFGISQDRLMGFQRIFNYFEQAELHVESATLDIGRAVSIFEYSNIAIVGFPRLVNSNAGDQSIVLRSKNSELYDSTISILPKFYRVGNDSLFCDNRKRLNDHSLNCICSSIDIVFSSAHVLGNLVNIVADGFALRNSSSDNIEISAFLYFAHGIRDNSFNPIVTNYSFGRSAIRGDDNFGIGSSYKNQSLSRDTTLANHENDKRHPKYLRFHAPIHLDFCEDDTGYCYEPTETARMFVSDDSINWFTLFPNQFQTISWGLEYGIRSFMYIPDTILLKRSSFESVRYDDYEQIIDLSSVDCDISFDAFKWFHIFDTDCVDGHLPYYESNAAANRRGSEQTQEEGKP